MRSASVPLEAQDLDSTRYSPPSRPLNVRPEATEVRPSAATPASQRIAARTPAAKSEPAAQAPAVAHVERRPWTFFVLIQVAALAGVVLLVTAIPLILWQGRVLDATASSRASALINWLAADARTALETNASVAGAADAVAREPGVVGALIVSTDGRVLSPASRSSETIDTLPGIGVKPGEILRLQQARNGDLVESARPVQAGARPRAAVAWLTYRPSAPPEAGSGAVVLALPVIAVLVAAWFTSRRISRRTMRALTLLNEDIELAVGGRLEAIGDPLGAKPVKDLADAVNYLIVKLRAAGAGEPAARPNPGAVRTQSESSSSPRSVPARAEAAASRGPSVPTRLEARLVANAQYRVTDASPGCAELIGARPDELVGHHLIDAIPDRDIADAVLKCLSALGPSGEQRASVQPAGRSYGVSIVVSREDKDRPLTIALMADRSAGVA